MAFGSFDLTSTRSDTRYPASGLIEGRRMTLRLMHGGDAEAMIAFARRLPLHDLLFLRRDITQREQVEVWLQRIQARATISLLLVDDQGEVCGYATVDRDPLPWSPHVAELRVLVAPELREQGVGRLLTEEAYRIALEMGVEKIIAQITIDQERAIAVFRSLGFQPEALLKDHVQDRQGQKHDLVILSHDVARALRSKAAAGVIEAVSGN